MYSEVAWEQVSWGTQVQPQRTLDPDYLPDYISVSYDCLNFKLETEGKTANKKLKCSTKLSKKGA